VIKKLERANFFAVGFPAFESALGGLLSKCLSVSDMLNAVQLHGGSWHEVSNGSTLFSRGDKLNSESDPKCSTRCNDAAGRTLHPESKGLCQRLRASCLAGCNPHLFASMRNLVSPALLPSSPPAWRGDLKSLCTGHISGSELWPSTVSAKMRLNLKVRGHVQVGQM